MGFFWVNFWSRDFLGILLEALRIFWVFIFAPIRSSLSLEIQSIPSPGGRGNLFCPVHCTWYKHEATNHHRIKVTQTRCYKYKWKKDYYFFFLKSWSHICKAYQSNALLQYKDILAECGGGRRFIDWWVTVPSARQCSSTVSIKAIIICN